MQVTVALKNPPSGGTMWTMVLTDWDITIPIREISGKERLDIAEAAAFEIPSGAMFPLRVVSLTITRWKDGVVGGTIQQLYSVQSYRPIKPFTDDEPDPTYKEVFIPDYGSYDYDVATEQFESLAPEPTSIEITAPDSAVEGKQVSVSARVTNTAADSYQFRVRIWAVRDVNAVPAPDELIGNFEEVIGSGVAKTYSASFTMPSWDTTVVVLVYRFIDYWDFDNYETKVVVSLAAPVEEFVGSIVKKELEYNEHRQEIPVY